MALLNTFRVTTASAVALAFWLLYFGDQSAFERLRRAPATVATVPDRCKTDRQFALTFDEGPSDNTAAVLDALKAANVKATFHPAIYAATTPFAANIKRAFDEGHLIGLRFPPGQDMRYMLEKDIVEIIVRDSQKIFDVIKFYPKFIRLEFGKYNDDTLKIIDKLGMIPVGWNLDFKDFSIPASTSAADAKTLISNYYNTEMQKSKSFISLQRDLYPLYKDQTILASQLTTLKGWGVNLVTMDQCLSETGSYRDKNVNYLPTSSRSTSEGPTSTSAPTPSTSPAKKNDASGKSLTVFSGVMALVSAVLLF
jgi:peptidoglycan/xylan/chitin deacetylase (PgdA/CDA1 family)